MTTSVVIVSYRPGDWLVEAINSVVDQADEVVVVDNGSPGATASPLARRAGARIVRSERNLGFAGGVNLGVQATTGDVIALLNDDARAGADWLSRASKVVSDAGVAAVAPKVRLAVSYQEVLLPDEEHFASGDSRSLGRQLRSVTVAGTEMLDGLLGHVHRLETGPGGPWRWTAGGRPFYVPLPRPQAVDEVPSGAEVLVDGSPPPPGPTCRLINSAGVYLRRDGYAGDVGLGAPDDGRFDEGGDRFALSGTALVTTADTWRRLGPLAAKYFAYYEDIDWCWRAHLAGLRLVYDPSSTVDHLRSATSGGAAAVRVMAERNRTLSMVRNGPRPEVARALAARWREGADGGVRTAVARRLPWAMATRVVATARGTATGAGEVWARWAGVDTSWDDGPARHG